MKQMFERVFILSEGVGIVQVFDEQMFDLRLGCCFQWAVVLCGLLFWVGCCSETTRPVIAEVRDGTETEMSAVVASPRDGIVAEAGARSYAAQSKRSTGRLPKSALRVASGRQVSSEHSNLNPALAQSATDTPFRSAEIVSITEARARLRPSRLAPKPPVAEVRPQGLAQSMSRHPAGKLRAAYSVRQAQGAESPQRLPDHRVGMAWAWRQRLSQLSLPATAAVGSVVAWATAVVVVFALALSLGLFLRPAPFAGETWVHSVSSGESVWGLAASLNLDRPLENVVNDILTLNALSDATIQAGQELILPAE